MSDERDETRRMPPSDHTLPAPPPARDDDTRTGSPPARDDDTRLSSSRAHDDTRLGPVPVSSSPAHDDSLLGPAPAHEDDTRLSSFPAHDDTRLGRAPADEGDTVPARRIDDTLPDGDAAAARARPDSTAVMSPLADDWAPSRANPVWSGRAEVRAPQPARTRADTDWTQRPVPVQRDRWWMPIVVGIIVLIMLAVLGWAVFLIVRSVDRQEQQQPTPAPSMTAATTAPATSEATTTPTTAPTTTTPTQAPSTVEPTTEVTVPALRGLSVIDAEAALQRRGLSYRLIYRAGDAQPGTVIDSDPAEGQEVPPDTTVTLVVAQGAATGATTTPAGSTTGTGVGGN